MERNESTAPPPPAEPPKRSLRLFWVGIGLFLLGVVALVRGAVLDTERLMGNPWRDAVLVSAPQPPWEGMREGRMRMLRRGEIPESAFEAALRAEPRGEELAESLQLNDNESVLLLDLPPDEWSALMGGAPIPKPGAFEVAAGNLCRYDTFTLDGQEFHAVGRIPAGTPFLSFTYVLPYSPEMARFFTDAAGGKLLWVDLEGRQRVEQLSAQEREALAPQLVEGLATASPAASGWAIAGMALAALGGSAAWIALFRWIPTRRMGFLGAVFRDMQAYPRLLWGVHILLYAVFIGCMLLALQLPVWNYRAVAVMRGQFEQGGLSFIGDAYRAGNIVDAAFATWAWNFGSATVLISLLPSLIVPGWALLKNLLSFGVVGFGMAPIWTGSIEPMTYHVVTMALELEGYILASFMALVYVAHIVRAFRGENIGPPLRHAFALMVSGGILAGVILALAACYEAATLILLHP